MFSMAAVAFQGAGMHICSASWPIFLVARISQIFLVLETNAYQWLMCGLEGRFLLLLFGFVCVFIDKGFSTLFILCRILKMSLSYFPRFEKLQLMFSAYWLPAWT